VSESTTGAYAPEHALGDDPSKVKQVAGKTQQAAGHAVSEVKDTATQQAQRVGEEAKTQVRNVAGDVRDKVNQQARAQNDRLVGSIRQTADHLDEMRGDRADSPAATMVSRVADGGRQLADYLDRNGPDGVLREVQDFARRRPGAFLATALAAGFVVGRLGKSVATADPAAGGTDVKPSSDAFAASYDQTGTPIPQAGSAGGTAGAGYAPPGETAAPYAGTETAERVGGYPATEYASTGTGTPVVVDEVPPVTRPESRP
jgi:hypothetical protein